MLLDVGFLERLGGTEIQHACAPIRSMIGCWSRQRAKRPSSCFLNWTKRMLCCTINAWSFSFVNAKAVAF